MQHAESKVSLRTQATVPLLTTRRWSFTFNKIIKQNKQIKWQASQVITEILIKGLMVLYWRIESSKQIICTALLYWCVWFFHEFNEYEMLLCWYPICFSVMSRSVLGFQICCAWEYIKMIFMLLPWDGFSIQ